MAYNTVKVKKYSDNIQEFVAAEAISPGMLVEQTPAAATLRKHATEGGNVVPIMFALEDELQGKGLADAYAVGAVVQVWIPYRGDVVYAQLEDEQEIAIGDELESNGAGFLQAHVADPGDSTVGSVQNAIVGVALEKLELSSLAGSESSSSPTRQFLKVRIV